MARRIANFVSVDEQTGEYYDHVLVPRRRIYEGQWMKLYQEAAVQEVALNTSLRGQSYRVLWYLAGSVRWHNELPGSAETAGKLNLNRRAVVRAYAELVRAGLIEKRKMRYHLSPRLGWRGTVTELREFKAEVEA